MDWYYVVNRQRVGPVSDEDFMNLVATKRIDAQTLVWNETLKDWTPFKKVKLPKAMKAMKPEPKPEKPMARQLEQELEELHGGEAKAGETSACSQCGKSFPNDDLADFSGSLVCAACKPAFVQKIKEGVSVGDMEYAGFWIRVGAKIIDGIIITVVSVIINFLAGMFILPNMMNPDMNPEELGSFMALAMIPAALQWAFNVFYITWFLGKFGATPGKMAFKLKVVTGENTSISYLRAFGRFWAELLSGMILGIGYLMVAFDSQKRGLHDRICNTRVVRQ
ncbi:MAG: RDD family protein [Desulfobacteraceae bacterium]|nr:MAG: RDD family protein [Desulfobacteraceae bacterium]